MDSLDLSAEYYRDVAYHESSLVALLLIDRKLVRVVDVAVCDFADPLWRELYRRLRLNPYQILQELLSDIEKCHYEIASAIVHPITGMDQVFPWNVFWHAAEVSRLAGVRAEFLRCLDFVLEHAA